MTFWKVLMADPLDPEPKVEPSEPILMRVRAIDVLPYRWALWCTIEGSPKPFANDIVTRRWSEDGEHLWFMLDSHNFLKAKPDEELELVRLDCSRLPPDFLARVDAEDAKRIAARPSPKQ